MKQIRTILGITAVLLTAATLQAQTYNDSVRTRTWSVYVQGGVSGYHGVRSELFDHSKSTIAPDLSLGVKYNLKPWVRLGVNAGYTVLKATDKTVQSTKTTDNNYLIGEQKGTLTTLSDRLQNRNNTHLLGADINVDFNILQIWPKRKAQWINLYVGAGLGYLHGWNRNTQTFSCHETAIAEGEGYANTYTHAYMKSSTDKDQFNAIYVPLSLSLEFDVARQLTIGAIGQYKYVPTKADFSPKGIYSAGIVVRYNFVKSKSQLQSKQIADLYSRLDAYSANCANEKANLQRQAAEEAARLKGEADNWKRQAEACQAAGKVRNTNTVVYFENNSWELSVEGNEQLKQLAGQLTADYQKKIMLVGSASAVGHAGGNQKLSDHRVDAVKQFLLGQGVNEAQIESEVSLGDRGMTDASGCRRVIVITRP